MDNKESLSSPFIPWLAACCTVFVSSACIMVLELTAGRIIARHIGVSLYTWTAVIGVIMLGMALGNHLGGRFADRYVPSRMLALLFLSAAGACFLILPLNSLAGMLHFLGGAAWPLRIFLHVSLVFLVPALLLGMIPPVVVKMALDLHRKAGRTVGSDIYLVGTVAMSDALAKIQAGQMTGTVYHDPATQAEKMAELLKKALKGTTFSKEEQKVYVDDTKIDADNVAQYIH